MSTTLSDFPGLNEVLIGSRTFLVNTSFEPYRRDAFRHRSLPTQRESVNIAGKTGEGTINTEGLWRCTATDWSAGAGQLYADHEDSSASRFYDCFGVDPFTVKNQATLLPASKLLESDSTIYSIITVGDLIFKYNQSGIYSSTDWITWTSVLSITAGPLYPTNMLSTDGANVYVGAPSGASVTGIWVIPITLMSGIPTVGTPQHYTADGGVNFVQAAGPRIFAGANGCLYDLTDTISQTGVHLPAPLAPQLTPTWSWSGACGGDAAFYFWGNSDIGNLTVGLSLLGNVPSAIWRSAMEPDGTALTAPAIALPMPNNELVVDVYNYLNYIFLHTSQGVRMCRTVNQNDPSGNAGDLVAGPLVPNLLHPIGIASGVEHSLLGNNRFVYFVWSDYDGEYSGLGVLDLETMLGELQPAYASYLMYNVAGGTVTNVAWDPVNNYPCFTLAAHGIVGADTSNLMPFGWIDSGRITYNIPDDKIACQGLIRRDPGVPITLTGTITAGSPITSLPVTATQGTIADGDIISVSNGWQVDVFQANGATTTGSTAITVHSHAPTVTYGSGSPVQDVTTPSATSIVYGAATMSIEADGGGFQQVSPLSPNTQADPPTLMSPLVRGEELNIRVYLTRDGSNTNAGPTLHRWMLKSWPAVASGATISPVVMLYNRNENADGAPRYTDPYDDYAYLEGLRLTKTPVTYKEGNYTAIVVVSEIDWLPFKERDIPDGEYGYEGDLIVYLKSIVG